ncbi:MAG: hypothetical protein AAGM40_08125, partial [Cyanobacteria bacterium J06573_2]
HPSKQSVNKVIASEAKQSQGVAVATLHLVPLAMTVNIFIHLNITQKSSVTPLRLNRYLNH